MLRPRARAVLPAIGALALLSCAGPSSTETRRLLSTDVKQVHTCRSEQDAKASPNAERVDVSVIEVQRCTRGRVRTQNVEVTVKEYPHHWILFVDLTMLMAGVTLPHVKGLRGELRLGAWALIPIGFGRSAFDLSQLRAEKRVELVKDESDLRPSLTRRPAADQAVFLRLPDGTLIEGKTAEDGWARLMLPEDANSAGGLTALLVAGGLRREVKIPRRPPPTELAPVEPKVPEKQKPNGRP